MKNYKNHSKTQKPRNHNNIFWIFGDFAIPVWSTIPPASECCIYTRTLFMYVSLWEITMEDILCYYCEPLRRTRHINIIH